MPSVKAPWTTNRRQLVLLHCVSGRVRCAPMHKSSRQKKGGATRQGERRPLVGVLKEAASA
eukprot:11391422-Alexandrium_andersonii.AAC.1